MIWCGDVFRELSRLLDGLEVNCRPLMLVDEDIDEVDGLLVISMFVMQFRPLGLSKSSSSR